jgi:lipoyl(octanoyl) transferase
MDLAPFDAIDVCGDADLKSIDLRTLGVSTTVEDAGRLVSQALLDELEAASEERA